MNFSKLITWTVNRSSHWSRTLAQPWFTVCCLLLCAPSLAQAESLILFPLEGTASPERRAQVEEQLRTILQDQGHQVTAPSESSHPTGRREMAAAAETNGAVYVVSAEMEDLDGHYRLLIHCYNHRVGRLEDLVTNVPQDGEHERLSDILSSMVRVQGLMDDAMRLTDHTADPNQDPDAERLAEEQRLAEEAAQREAEAQRLAEEAAQREAEAQRLAEQTAQREEAWANRRRYGTDGTWMTQLGFGINYAVPLGDCPEIPSGCPGGELFTTSFHLGHALDNIEGLELRAGLHVTSGSILGIGATIGASWQDSFFHEDIFIGASGELGALFTISGSRDVGFRAQLAPTLSWRPIDNLSLETQIELGVLTAGAGAFTIGGSLHAAYRFD